MPIYQYECDECGEVRDEIRCIADRDKRLYCKCGCVMRREQTPVRGVVRNPAVPRKGK